MISLKAAPVICTAACGTAVTGIALAPAGRGLADVIIIGALVIATVIPALAAQLFWLLALTQPSRDLRRLLRQTRSTRDAERLARQLHQAEEATISASSNDRSHT
jgi:hypothetical protein